MDYVPGALAETPDKPPADGYSYSVSGHFKNLNWRYLQYIRFIQGLCKRI
jgi:hypothetical protein